MPIAVVIELIQILPQLVQAGISLAPVILKFIATIEAAKADGRAPSDVEWQAMLAHAKSLQPAA